MNTGQTTFFIAALSFFCISHAIHAYEFSLSSDRFVDPQESLAEIKELLARKGNVYDPEPEDEHAPLDPVRLYTPYWRPFQVKPRDEINRELRKIMTLIFPIAGYYLQRYLIASAIHMGADPNTGTWANPLLLTIKRNDIDLARLLLKKGAWLEPSFIFYATTPEMVQFLVKAGANLKARLADGSTLLHRWMEDPYSADLVRRFKITENLFTPDNNGDLPLHYLCRKHSSSHDHDIEKAKLLLQGLADSEMAQLLVTENNEQQNPLKQILNRRDGQSPLFHYLCECYRKLQIRRAPVCSNLPDFTALEIPAPLREYFACIVSSFERNSSIATGRVLFDRVYDELAQKIAPRIPADAPEKLKRALNMPLNEGFAALHCKVPLGLIMGLFRVAHKYEYKPVYQFAGREVMQFLLKEPRLSEWVKKRMSQGPWLQELARWHFLLTGNNIPEISPESYGFSVQELEDYKRYDKPVLWRDTVCLEVARIVSLEGLGKLQCVDSLIDRIYLYQNRIEEIPPFLFTQFDCMTFLNLFRNNIKSLASPYLFPATLIRLNLSYNRISRIESEALPPLLQEIDLTGNPISRDEGNLQALRKDRPSLNIKI